MHNSPDLLPGGDPLHGFARGDDGNARIAAQRQQIALVPRCDELGCTGQSCCQHVVVIGIGGHHAWHVRRRDHDGELAQVIHKYLRAQAGLSQAVGKLAGVEHIEQLGQKDFAGAQLELAGARRIQERGSPPNMRPETSRLVSITKRTEPGPQAPWRRA